MTRWRNLIRCGRRRKERRDPHENLANNWQNTKGKWSGRRDSNSGPPAPKAGRSDFEVLCEILADVRQGVALFVSPDQAIHGIARRPAATPADSGYPSASCVAAIGESEAS